MILDANKILGTIFGKQWQRVRLLQEKDKPEMYLAHDICEILEITNVTNAIKGINGQHRVDMVNRDKQYVKDWNPRRKVHLLSLAGVFQLIMHNRTKKCYEIRNYIACRYLPNAQQLVLHEPIRSKTRRTAA